MGKLDIIEPPSPFDPVEEWEEFLAQMQAEEQTPRIKRLVEKAKAGLEERRLRAEEETEEKKF